MHRLLVLLILCSPLALAADPPPPLEVPPPPAPVPAPDGVAPDSELEPEVKIIKRAETTVTEYSIKGEVYMVKIQPRVGPPYYLIDTDGDGTLESRYNKLEPNLLVPNWMIYRW